MKKGIIVILVLLAALIIVSPGIIGMLAEKSVDDQIEWAETENGDLRITAESFDRGWFSSQGRHRIELQDSTNAASIKDALGMRVGDSLPALLVDTHLNHGPLALGSDSLKPGLGTAESTLSLEMPDGEIVPLPGVVNSSLGLNGDLQSVYEAAAGAGEFASWGDMRVELESKASNGALDYDGSIPTLRFEKSGDTVAIDDFSFSGDLEMSEFGFAVGDMRIDAANVSVETGGQAPMAIGPVVFDTKSSVDGSNINSESLLSVRMSDMPGFGAIGMDMKVAIEDVDGHALKRLVEAAQAMPNSDPMDMASGMEQELLDVFAGGADISIDQLDIDLPQGMVRAVANLSIAESDPDNFAWTSLLLAMQADAKLEVPETLVNMAMLMAPNAEMLQSFLVKNGDVYEVEAAYQKGLLTVNGMPLPMPIR